MSGVELYHFGIPGMKWGVRKDKYRNADGSYTKRGIKRYGYNLDINNKSRKNIAKIRTGEAKRKYDVAKRNNSTNDMRLAQLKMRVRSAKRNEKHVKNIDKGLKRIGKGETIGGNSMRVAIGWGAAYIGDRAFRSFLNKRLKTVASRGRYTSQHARVANVIANVGTLALYGAAVGYNVKKSVDNKNIRGAYSAMSTGRASISNVGSQEYKDRVRELNKKRR